MLICIWDELIRLEKLNLLILNRQIYIHIPYNVLKNQLCPIFCLNVERVPSRWSETT